MRCGCGCGAGMTKEVGGGAELLCTVYCALATCKGAELLRTVYCALSTCYLLLASPLRHDIVHRSPGCRAFLGHQHADFVTHVGAEKGDGRQQNAVGIAVGAQHGVLPVFVGQWADDAFARHGANLFEEEAAFFGDGQLEVVAFDQLAFGRIIGGDGVVFSIGCLSCSGHRKCLLPRAGWRFGRPILVAADWPNGWPPAARKRPKANFLPRRRRGRCRLKAGQVACCRVRSWFLLEKIC